MKVTLIAAMLLAGAQVLAPQASAQQANRPLASVLPIAAGALVGAAAAFFVLPLVVPATATAATAGVSATASPVLAMIGAGVGGFIGHEFAP